MISIIIPVYNEEQSIENTIDKIKETQKHITAFYNQNRVEESEIIIVNDCSTDKTLEILNKIKDITILSHKRNKGYGASLKTGIQKASGEWIAITDADGTYPIQDLPKLWEHCQEYDMVVGSRTGKNVKIPFVRKPAKWIVNKLAEYVSEQKIPDLNSGLRIFKKDIALRFWNLFPEGFSFTSTLTLACLTNGIDVKYIPIDYYKREGKSSIKAKHFAIFCSLMMRICMYFKPLKIFIPASIPFFAAGIARMIRDFIVVGYFGTGGAILFIAGINLLFLGLIADLIIRRTKL